LTGGNITICIDKSRNLRIIIPALQIVESRLGVVVVATVAEGVVLCGGGGTAVYIGGSAIAPGIVGGARRERCPRPTWGIRSLFQWVRTVPWPTFLGFH